MAFSVGYFILYAVLISQICNSQDCTTKKGDSCIFPFKYKNKTYTGCNSDEKKRGKPWCSTKVDSKGSHEEGRGGVTWGVCSTGCPLDGDRTCGETSHCIYREKCPKYIKFLNLSKDDPKYETERNELKASICNREEKRLCCSVGDADQARSGKYLPPLGKCGKELSSDRIVGGVNAGLGEFPWAALLGYTIRKRRQEYQKGWVIVKNTVFRCGGTLINTRYVLTAAHCHNSANNISSVVLGEWQVGKDPDCAEGSRSGSSCKPRRQKIEVESVIVHEGYRNDKRSGEVVNDIALIRLKSPAELNEAVQPICLPLNEKDTAEEIGIENLGEGIVGRHSTIIGWGTIENGVSTNNDCQGVPHCILQKVDIPIISNQNCQAELNNLTQEAAAIRSSHICAVSYEDSSRHKDSCKGDSGGGMFISKNLDDKTDDTYYQVGIVSYGLSKYCGIGYPGVYTRVTEFMPWIRENLRD